MRAPPLGAPEALNRAHQGAYEPRIEALELHFREGGAPPPPLQVFSAWRESFWAAGRFKRFVERAFYLHVILLHIVILLGGAALFLLLPPVARAPAPVPPASEAPR